MSGELEQYDPHARPRMVDLVGVDRLLGLPPSNDRVGTRRRPVILRENVEEPDGMRTTREVEFPKGW